MPEPEYVHGGSDEREVARLEKQAGFFARLIFPDFDVPAGARVLDLGTGVAAMAAELAARWPDATVIGIDLSAAQLGWARRNHPAIPVARADAACLPFADASFERVHCSWLLEHVRDPVAILREVHRVLRPGGYCLFTEVDNATFTTKPHLEVVFEVFAALNRFQLAAGGDPYIGSKLEACFAAAGFTRVERLRSELHGHDGDPELFAGFVTEIAEIFEGLDESLGGAGELGPDLEHRLARAAMAVRGLPGSGGEVRYRPAVVKGWP